MSYCTPSLARHLRALRARLPCKGMAQLCAPNSHPALLHGALQHAASASKPAAVGARCMLPCLLTRQAVQLADGVHTAAAPCQHLVNVCLVAHIPDDLVFGRVEHVVQRHRQLHHAQAGPKVPASLGHGVDQVCAMAGARAGRPRCW